MRTLEKSLYKTGKRKIREIKFTRCREDYEEFWFLEVSIKEDGNLLEHFDSEEHFYRHQPFEEKMQIFLDVAGREYRKEFAHRWFGEFDKYVPYIVKGLEEVNRRPINEERV